MLLYINHHGEYWYYKNITTLTFPVTHRPTRRPIEPGLGLGQICCCAWKVKALNLISQYPHWIINITATVGSLWSLKMSIVAIQNFCRDLPQLGMPHKSVSPSQCRVCAAGVRSVLLLPQRLGNCHRQRQKRSHATSRSVPPFLRYRYSTFIDWT